MEAGGLFRTRGQHERLQGRERRLECVDGGLERGDLVVGDRGDLVRLRRRGREARADVEQRRLHAREDRLDRGLEAGGASEAHGRVRLVHVAVGLDAGVALAHAAAAEEAGRAVVAGPRVDLHARSLLRGDGPGNRAGDDLESRFPSERFVRRTPLLLALAWLEGSAFRGRVTR